MLVTLCENILFPTLDEYTVEIVEINPYTVGGRSSVGRAPDCGSGCRGFESRRSPHPSPFTLFRSYGWQAHHKFLDGFNTRGFG